MPSPPLLTSSFFPSFFPFASFRLSNVFLTKPHPCPPLQSSSLLFSSHLTSPHPFSFFLHIKSSSLHSEVFSLLPSPLLSSSHLFCPLQFFFHFSSYFTSPFSPLLITLMTLNFTCKLRATVSLFYFLSQLCLFHQIQLLPSPGL